MTTSTPEDLLAQAIAASRANDSDTALALLGQASAAAPAWGVPQFLIASEYASLGQMDRAEAAFANAVLLAPELSIARYQLGLLQFSSGRAAMALVTWQPLLELPGDDPLSSFVRGFAELAQDRFDAALGHFRQGMAANRTNAALNGDVQKVIDRIEATVAESRDPAAEAEHDEDRSHVLLSNYQRHGSLH